MGVSGQPVDKSRKQKDNKQKKYLETNESGNVTYQNLWDVAKAGLRGKFIVINAKAWKQVQRVQ